MSDLETIELKEGVDPDDAPIAPIDDVPLGDAEVMGGIRVNETDKDEGGVWRLSLDASFAVQAVSVTEVDERLETGTYLLVRVDE